MDRKCHAKFVNDRGWGLGWGDAVDFSAPAVSTGEPDVADLLVMPKKERVVCLQSGVGGGGWGWGGGGGVALTVFCVSENHFICKS